MTDAEQLLALQLEVQALSNRVRQFIPQAVLIASQTTTSTTFTDLGTVGPTISDLPDGSYVVIFGADAKTSVAGLAAGVAVSENGSTPSDSYETRNANTNFATVSRAYRTSILTGGPNTLELKYRVGGAATATFDYRWLQVIRVA